MRTRWNLRKADWKIYAQCSNRLLTDSAIEGNVDKALRNIKLILLRCAQIAVPRGSVKKYTPFWNDELQKLKGDRDNARKVAERTGNAGDRILLKQKSASLKKNIIKAKRESYRTFLEKLDQRKDGVEAHRFLSSMNNEVHLKNNPIVCGSKLLTNKMDIARHFCKHYSQVSNFRPSSVIGKIYNQLTPTCLSEEQQQLFISDFDMGEMEVALRQTKAGTSAGPDELMPEFLIHLGTEAKSIVLRFLNKVWRSYLPSEWNKAEVIPILKKGKTPDNVESYRPISLTSIFCKLLERMILRRLQTYLEKHEILSSAQGGFRKNHSTIEQVVRLSQEIKEGYHRHQSTIAVFVDFKTAFDRVWRKLLLQKLLDVGIHGNMYKFIESFLSQRFIRVRYGNSTSQYKQIKQGLPQGSVLSPTLFCLMMDDVVHAIEAMPGTQALLYADDLVFWATSGDIPALQSHISQVLNSLSTWARANEMIVNASKTEFQLFTMSTKKYDVILKYENEELKRTDQATYLGVTLDSKLNWGKHTMKLADKGIKRTRLLKRITGTKWGASQDILALAYKSYVRPVLEYGGELLITAAESVTQKIERVQNRALRIITGAPKSTPIEAMLLQAELEPTYIRRESGARKMHEKLKRRRDITWNNKKPPTVRLKTQVSFWSKVEELGSLSDPGPTSPIQMLSAIPERVPSKLALARFELIKPLNKESATELELRACALETIHTWYPSPIWTRVYTDGSAEEARRNAGAGVYSASFQLSVAVGRYASNFDGEIAAIEIALMALLDRADTHVVLLVDSQAAIAAVTNPARSSSESVIRCKELLEKLLLRATIVILQWIPAHCGVHGNEEADKLAKLGAKKSQPDTAVTFLGAKKMIKCNMKSKLEELLQGKAEGKVWAPLLNPANRVPAGTSRKKMVALFRMTTGHDYLQSHLYRIGVVNSPICPLCGLGEMNASHLDTCNALSDIRSSKSCKSDWYWAARSRMAEAANDNGVR